MRTLLVVVLLLGAPTFLLSSSSAAPLREPLPSEAPGRPTEALEPEVFGGSGAPADAGARQTAGPDTFLLYGGPDRPLEGKFEDATGAASWNGWTSYDGTWFPSFWHVSTFNAANLNDHGTGNHALWCGQDADDQPGWATPPGYGNEWFQVALYESAPLDDPSVGQTVGLDFVFNHDLEFDPWRWWDLFYVDYDSAGTWVRLCTVGGTSADSLGVFAAPGVRFSDVVTRDIVYVGNDYGGDAGDRIRIRWLVETDFAASDQDGWYDSRGAVQVDDVSLHTSQGDFSEDFEGPAPWLLVPVIEDFAGDFAEVYPGLEDIDPCRANPSPVVGFIDYGQVVRNGPGANGLASTGGSTSPGVNYGLPGNWVTNYSGGLSLGVVSLYNGITSPEIGWDLPGAADDATDIVGLKLRFDVWQDLPLENGIFLGFDVRSARAGEPMVDDWNNNGLIYYSTLPTWRPREFDLSDLLGPDPDRVQVRLWARDAAWYFPWIPGGAGTPSPVFDNVSVLKYRMEGIALSARRPELPQDGFPVSGGLDVSTPAARDALDVPVDMAQDVNSGDLFVVPGDSIVVTAAALIPGTALSDLRMFWTLRKNPLFEDTLRSPPAGPRDLNVDASDPLVWTGEVLADTCTWPSGAVATDRYFFDLPDEDFLYPGDVLQFYLRAEDSDGRVTTLPADLSGFGGFDDRHPRYASVHALPSLLDPQGTQPPVLVLVETGEDRGFPELTTSFAELGQVEGVDYDVYWRIGVGFGGVSSGIGSAGGHGATAAQVAGYSTMLHFAGFRGPALSDGIVDKSDDLELLEQWHALPGRRNMACFGDRTAQRLVGMADGRAFLNNTMGVDYLGPDVIPYIGDQVTPIVQSAGAAFGTSWLLDFNCQTDESDPDNIGIIPHNHVVPEGGAVYGHRFVDGATGQPIAGPAASVVLASPRPGVTGYDVFFPYSISWIYPRPGRAPVGASDRTMLLQELLDLFGEDSGPGVVVGAPPRHDLSLRAAPNPFNPRTVIRFDVAQGERGSVAVYDLRGALVRTLHRGDFLTTEFSWDGRDDAGAAVASGVYLVRATAGRATRVLKIALVR